MTHCIRAISVAMVTNCVTKVSEYVILIVNHVTLSVNFGVVALVKRVLCLT